MSQHQSEPEQQPEFDPATVAAAILSESDGVQIDATVIVGEGILVTILIPPSRIDVDTTALDVEVEPEPEVEGGSPPQADAP